jgi:hypothetical protein
MVLPDTGWEMNLTETHETIDRLLREWQPSLGADYLPYRNHVYRVYHIAAGSLSATEEEREQLAIAAAFHDIGIWLDGTFDYLDPSSRRAREYLSRIGRDAWAETMHQMIEQHHRIRPWRGPDAHLVEAFRKADWFDVCLFALPSRLAPASRSELLRVYPRLGFHRGLVVRTWAWARKHPLDPLPIFKW